MVRGSCGSADAAKYAVGSACIPGAICAGRDDVRSVSSSGNMLRWAKKGAMAYILRELYVKEGTLHI